MNQKKRQTADQYSIIFMSRRFKVLHLLLAHWMGSSTLYGTETLYISSTTPMFTLDVMSICCHEKDPLNNGANKGLKYVCSTYEAVNKCSEPLNGPFNSLHIHVNMFSLLTPLSEHGSAPGEKITNYINNILCMYKKNYKVFRQGASPDLQPLSSSVLLCLWHCLPFSVFPFNKGGHVLLILT